jgi:hypothetical protein
MQKDREIYFLDLMSFGDENILSDVARLDYKLKDWH